LTSWSQAVASATAIAGPSLLVNLNPCGVNIGPPGSLGATCSAIHAGQYYLDVPLPNTMPDLLGQSVSTSLSNYETRFGKRSLRLYCNAPISSAAIAFTGYSGSTDKDANYTLTWTSASDTVIVEFAAHIAVGVDPLRAGIGYGANKGAA